MYTQFCRELAAQGCIVIALEHEDASGIYATCAKTGEVIEYKTQPLGMDDETFRRPFLKQRVQELSDSIGAILDLAHGVDIVTEQSEEEKALADVLRFGDPNRLLLVGHSFGAAGIIRYLGGQGARPADHSLKGVVLLDVYTKPLPSAEVEQGLQWPWVYLISDAWQADYGHSCTLPAFSGDKCLGSVLVRGTEHTWVSDLHLFAPAWMLRCFGFLGTGTPQRCLRATVGAAWLFLKSCGDEGQVSRKSFAEGVLAIDGEVLSVAWPSSAPASRVEAWPSAAV